MVLLPVMFQPRTLLPPVSCLSQLHTEWLPSLNTTEKGSISKLSQRLALCCPPLAGGSRGTLSSHNLSHRKLSNDHDYCEKQGQEEEEK